MFKKAKASVAASLAAFFAAAAAANPDHNFRNYNEASPDLGLPRPAWIQKQLMVTAEAKRERKGARLYNKVLEGKFDKNGNPLTILQQKSS